MSSEQIALFLHTSMYSFLLCSAELCRIRNVIAKQSLGGKSLNFASFDGAKKQICPIDHTRITGITIFLLLPRVKQVTA